MRTCSPPIAEAVASMRPPWLRAIALQMASPSDTAWRVGVAQAVLQHVTQQLFDARAVPTHRQRRQRTGLDAQLEALGGRACLEALDRLLGKRHGVEVVETARQRLQVRQRQQVHTADKRLDLSKVVLGNVMQKFEKSHPQYFTDLTKVTY